VIKQFIDSDLADCRELVAREERRRTFWRRVTVAGAGVLAVAAYFGYQVRFHTRKSSYVFFRGRGLTGSRPDQERIQQRREVPEYVYDPTDPLVGPRMAAERRAQARGARRYEY
jgi:hypothetical protein